jgi:hypothetical protein
MNGSGRKRKGGEGEGRGREEEREEEREERAERMVAAGSGGGWDWADLCGRDRGMVSTGEDVEVPNPAQRSLVCDRPLHHLLDGILGPDREGMRGAHVNERV